MTYRIKPLLACLFDIYGILITWCDTETNVWISAIAFKQISLCALSLKRKGVAILRKSFFSVLASTSQEVFPTSALLKAKIQCFWTICFSSWLALNISFELPIHEEPPISTRSVYKLDLMVDYIEHNLLGITSGSHF